MEMTIYNNDCLEQLKMMPDECIDSVVTDPPYGLAFMGKKWDYDVPSIEIWKEVYRVLKPGGHLLSFGGTRTYHRMAIAIEDAGFEIRDQIMWIYGSGFPKSMDISKAIDKQAGVKREIVATINKTHIGGENGHEGWMRPSHLNEDGTFKKTMDITAPATESAKQWQGWGTALKPANEPICLARKPLSEKTVASNVLKHGTGAINIDECRIEGQKRSPEFKNPESESGWSGLGVSKNLVNWDSSQGRWPANVILDEEAGKVMDEQSGYLSSGGQKRGDRPYTQGVTSFGGKQESSVAHKDSGGASRFFYVAKASKSERNKGLEGMPERETKRYGDFQGTEGHAPKLNVKNTNFHPTVKPIKLMEYLCRLITPPSGVVLDPFMGSGTTGIAAKNLGFGFVGIERDAEYFEIAKRRTA